MQTLFIRFFVPLLLSQICLIARAQGQIENHAPVVKIIEPQADEELNWNSLLPYAIGVEDREDGNSAYEEITEQEVLLIVAYLEDSSLASAYLAGINTKLKPLFAMSQSTCLSCHTANKKLIGPSFDLIAQKYAANDTAQSYLSRRVITGGTGVWGEEHMPPHPNLSEQEADLIIDWILMQADNPTQFYVGLEGAIKLPEAPSDSENGIYVLTAAYQDHGLPNSPHKKKQGIQSILLPIRKQYDFGIKK